jgi:hypothetical protein
MTHLVKLADDLFHAETFLRPGGGVKLPARMVVLRDRDGGLVVYSPIDISEELAAEVDRVGEVHSILGPNLVHHLYLRSAAARWPKAKLLGAPGLDAKRSNLDFAKIVEDGAVAPGIEAHRIAGTPMINEVVLLHEASGTLVCADMVFRIREAHGWSKVVFQLMGDYGDTLLQSRLWRLTIKDRAAYQRSVSTLFEKDFDAVVMAHGEPLMEGAKAQLVALHR